MIDYPSYYSLEEIVNSLPISILKNTDDDSFWYTTKNFTKRYKHEEAKKGDTFWDGNNGDRWIVHAVNLEYKRMIVENLSQSGRRLVYWNN